MKRRIILALFVVVTSAVTITFALWYSGVFEEWACANRGGKWVEIRKLCVVE